ncbi:MAG: glycosyltransferase, partial [Eggerthellaceae bacterium]|nr:glycosyltransferase [Eggerthellaceae bacterium]
ASGTSAAGDASTKAYAADAGVRAVQSHLDRLGLDAKVGKTHRPFRYRVAYAPPPQQPCVSILIPNRVDGEGLKRCLDSILTKTSYANLELVIIGSEGVDEEVLQECRERAQNVDVRVLPCERGFNLPKMLNLGAAAGKGEYLVALSSDAELQSPDWIETMLGICARNDVGMVGAKLYHPNDTAIHEGLVMPSALALASGRYLPKEGFGFLSLGDTQQDVTAISPACFMTKRSAFDELEGFDEGLEAPLSMLDYCSKIRSKGLLIVYNPEAELFCFDPSHQALLSPYWQ